MARTDVPLTALGEMAGSVARAIGGPLTAIGMAVDRLQARDRDATDAVELGVIQDQVYRMGALAETLRSIAQPARGRPHDLAINPLVEELVCVVRERMGRAGIRVETEMAPRLPAARGDARQVREVLLALLFNAELALEGWDGPREVRVTTGRAPDGRVAVSVRDSGPGVPCGDEERIFLPFVSGWGRDGMGLSFSRLILLGQEGELGVESPDGSGACFTIRLPPASSGGAGRSDTEMSR